ncbi:DUF4358 domain-containing protein [Holdemania massiliensis]|nr:DUF4358 domain-containing protein [Holdemania massiliensis]
MKKLIIGCIVVSCLMLTGCSKKNPQPTPTPSVTPSTEPTMTPSASPETAEGLKGIMEAIRRNDEYQLPMSMDVDDTVLMDMYGLSSDLVKDYAIFMPAMNVHATEIILVEAQDGKLEEVKKALDKRLETIEQTWSTYLPEQYELVKNRKTLEQDNVIAIVIADQADAILKDITDSLNASAQ